MDYRIPNGKLLFKNFASQLNSETTTRRSSARPTGGNDDVSFYHNYEEAITRNISNSLAGEHNFSNGILNWKLSYSYSTSKNPTDWQVRFSSGYMAYTGTNADLMNPPDKIYEMFEWDLSKVRFQDVRVNWNERKAQEMGAELNYEFPWQLSNSITCKFKFGGKYRFHDRKADHEYWVSDQRIAGGYELHSDLVAENAFPGQELEFVDGMFLAYSNFIDESVKISDLLKNYGFLANTNHHDMEKIAGFYDMSPGSGLPYYMKEDITTDYSDYKNTSNYSAGYILTEMKLGNRLTFIPGIRYEYVNHDFDVYYIDYRGVYSRYKDIQGIKKDMTAAPSNTHWLPMIHLRYQITDWSDIRLASTKTLRRPNYFQYSPQLFISEDEIRRGNPDLKVETSQNFDAQASIYSNFLGLFSVGGFYKKIDNYIYQVTSFIHKDEIVPGLPSTEFLSYDPENDFVGYVLTEPINNEKPAYVRGLEFELQSHFWYLPKPFDGLVLNTNISFIDTETEYPQYVETGGTPPWYRDKVNSLIYREYRMQNQPATVGNISVGYDKGGFSGRLSFYYQGNTLSYVDPVFIIQDRYKDDIQRWDLKLKQKLTRQIDLFFDLNNFTNDPDVIQYNVTDYIQQKENYGLQSSLSIRYTFQ